MINIILRFCKELNILHVMKTCFIIFFKKFCRYFSYDYYLHLRIEGKNGPLYLSSRVSRSEVLYLLVIIHRLIAMILNEFVSLSRLEVFTHHFGNEFVERRSWRPAEFFSGFCGIT
jgi:hypothetical protein